MPDAKESHCSQSGECRFITHIRELIEVREVASANALRLQAREYERRLEDLNHNHKRMQEAGQRTVSIEVYDVNRRNDEGRLYALEKQLTAEVARRSGRSEILAGLAVVMSLTLPLILKFFVP